MRREALRPAFYPETRRALSSFGVEREDGRRACAALVRLELQRLLVISKRRVRESTPLSSGPLQQLHVPLVALDAGFFVELGAVLLVPNEVDREGPGPCVDLRIGDDGPVFNPVRAD